MSGEIDVKIDSIASFRAALDTGRIKPLCMINAGGQTITPNQKSLQEQMGITIHSYFGMVGPAGVDPALVASLSKALIEIVQLEELEARTSCSWASTSPPSARKTLPTTCSRT